MLPDAVRFAAERNSVLQSAREAVAFRIAARGADDANLYQATRTAAIYLRDRDRFYVAFDDDPQENILLLRANEGYDAHRSNGRWPVHKDDRLIRSALQRAAKADRILPVPLESPLRLSTGTRNGASEYAASKVIKATIGNIAEPYAAFLNSEGFANGYEWLLTPSSLEQIGVTSKNAEVRRVGVGGVDVGMNDLDAIVRCFSGCRARGVRLNRTRDGGAC